MGRKYYSPTLKRQALNFYKDHHESEGWTVVRVAHKYSINPNTLNGWIGQEGWNQPQETKVDTINCKDAVDLKSKQYSRRQILGMLMGIRDDVQDIENRLSDSISRVEKGEV